MTAVAVGMGAAIIGFCTFEHLRTMQKQLWRCSHRYTISITNSYYFYLQTQLK